MNTKFTFFKISLTLIFAIVALVASAQSFSGPSDATTAPPSSAGTVSEVLCAGSTISLKTTSTPGYTYQWYKKNTGGTYVMVQSGSSSTYTETASGDGYYTYELVQINGTNCSSVVSDPFNVYVLPTLSASITATKSAICETDATSPVLTATPTASNNKTNSYTYTYQWTKDGTNISGATTNTYTVIDRTPGSNSVYGVNIQFSLNSSCSASTSTTITINPIPSKPTIVVGP